MSDTQFVSVEEFGRRTSLSIRSVWRLLQRGLLPSLRVGRRRLVPLAEALDALRKLDAHLGRPRRALPQSRRSGR